MEAPPSHSHGNEAWKIVSGPGTLEERSLKLKELQERYPDDRTIADWGSALEDEYEMAAMRARIEGEEQAREAAEGSSAG